MQAAHLQQPGRGPPQRLGHDRLSLLREQRLGAGYPQAAQRLQGSLLCLQCTYNCTTLPDVRSALQLDILEVMQSASVVNWRLGVVSHTKTAFRQAEALHSCTMQAAAHKLRKGAAAYEYRGRTGSAPLACPWEVKKDRKMLRQPSTVTARSSGCSAASMVSMP